MVSSSLWSEEYIKLGDIGVSRARRRGAVTDLGMGTLLGFINGKSLSSESLCDGRPPLGVSSSASLISAKSLPLSSSVSPILPLSEGAMVYSSVLSGSKVLSGFRSFGLSGAFQGRFRGGVLGGSGSSTVKSRLNGHGVVSY